MASYIKTHLADGSVSERYGAKAAKWTDEKIALLRALWPDHSASQIATKLKMGITRNAVIGKAHRLGLARKMATYRVGAR